MPYKVTLVFEEFDHFVDFLEKLSDKVRTNENRTFEVQVVEPIDQDIIGR